eukprot:2982704-Pleurochrysis_carterae.AAC.1
MSDPAMTISEGRNTQAAWAKTKLYRHIMHLPIVRVTWFEADPVNKVEHSLADKHDVNALGNPGNIVRAAVGL